MWSSISLSFCSMKTTVRTDMLYCNIRFYYPKKKRGLAKLHILKFPRNVHIVYAKCEHFSFLRAMYLLPVSLLSQSMGESAGRYMQLVTRQWKPHLSWEMRPFRRYADGTKEGRYWVNRNRGDKNGKKNHSDNSWNREALDRLFSFTVAPPFGTSI